MGKNEQEKIAALSSKEARKFFSAFDDADVRELALRKTTIRGIDAQSAYAQLASRKKAREKLPRFFLVPGIVFPPPENLEQSSSEITARFKAGIVSNLRLPANRGADITGGFGVDAYFLSKAFREFYFAEPDEYLVELARHNHGLLGAANILHLKRTAEEFIEESALDFDFIYIDPSRRTGARRKISSLGDSQPDVTALLPALFKKSPMVLIKAAPLFDVQAGIAQLTNTHTVYVVSVGNECRELLFLCKRGFAGTAALETVNLSGKGDSQSFSFTLDEERNARADFSPPRRFLYEANASIMKAGAFKSVAVRYGLLKLAPNTHLYTSDNLVAGFPGKTFEIEALVKSDPSALKEFFPGGKANVTTRNYPLSPEMLKKKTGLKDGGEKYLIGFAGENRKFLAVASRL